MTAIKELLGWFGANKEAIAAVGGLLGLVPTSIAIVGQMTRARREERSLGLARQRLELAKLQYEVERLRLDLGAPLPAAPAGLSVAPPKSSGPPPLPATAPVASRPEWIEALHRHPQLAAPLLWIGQAITGVCFWASVLVAFSFPFMIISDDQVRTELGGLQATLIEAVYILMVLGFRVSYRKLGAWRRSRPPPQPGSSG